MMKCRLKFSSLRKFGIFSNLSDLVANFGLSDFTLIVGIDYYYFKAYPAEDGNMFGVF